MFAIPFGRIFWKEYRTNRALWLACLFIGVFLQMVLCLSMSGPHGLANSIVINRMAALISVMYALGCGALMFATEREERTSDWLLSLSAPALPVLFAKTSFAIISTLSLQILMVMSALVFLAGAVPVQVPDEGWSPLLTSGGMLMLIWSCLGSLISRRVMNSILASVFWMCISMVFIQLALESSTRFIHFPSSSLLIGQPWYNAGWTWWIGGVIAMAMNCWLGLRWCHGNYVDADMLESFRSNVLCLATRQRRKVANSSLVSLSTEYDQFWRRSWQRLVWQERHRSRLPSILLRITCSLCVLVILLAFVVGSDSHAPSLLWFCLIAPCLLTPVTMGLLAFEVDSSQQQPRFVAHRGISWTAFWFAKQYVWLIRALFISLVMGVVLFLTTIITGKTSQASAHLLDCFGSIGFMRSEYLMMRHRAIQFTELHVAVWVSRAIWFVLLTYAGGQLASQLFRRTTMAIVFGGVVVSFLTGWLILIDVCQLPFHLFMALPFAAVMWITFWQTKPWLLEDQSWKRFGKLGAVLVVLPISLLALLGFVRVSEAYETWRMITYESLTEFRLRVQERESQKPERVACSWVLNRLNTMLPDAESARPAIPQAVLEVIEEKQSSLNSSDLEWWQKYNLLQTVDKNLQKLGDRLFNDGRLADSLKCRLASLKLGRAMAHGNVNAWWSGYWIQQSTLEKLIPWANHSEQTTTAVQDGIAEITAELDQFPSCTTAVVESYIELRRTWVLSSSAKFMEEFFTRGWSQSSLHQLVACTFALPTERARTDLLLTRMAENIFQDALRDEAELKRPENHRISAAPDNPISKNIKELDRLRMTTPAADVASPWPLSEYHDAIKRIVRTKRAALIRLHLIAYRLEHGNLPERLVELLPALANVDLIDPWSDRMFDYYPTFLLSGGKTNCAVFPISSTEVEVVYDGENYRSRVRIRLDEPLDIDEVSESNFAIRQLKGTLFSIPPGNLEAK